MNPPLPAGLRPEEIALLVQELAPIAVGARIGKIFDLGKDNLLFRLRARGETHYLLVSVRAGFSRFHLVGKPAGKPLRSETARALRELLTGTRILSLAQPGGDRILRVEVKGPSHRLIVLEMFGARGRLLVLAEHDREVLFQSGRGGIAN